MSDNGRATVHLIDRYRNGDETAFTLLYDRHAKAVRTSIARRLGNTLRDLTEVDDVLQETFLAAWRYIEEGCYEHFETVGRFRSLLVKIAMQKVLDEARHHRRSKRDLARSVPLDGASELADRTPRPSSIAREKEIAELKEQALLELGDQDRWLLDCRENLEMSYEEIGEELGCKPANAKLRHYRAMERLRERIRRKGVE